MTNLQPEIDNLLHQLAQPSIAPFAIADLTRRLQKLLTARWFEQHPIDAPTCVCGCALDANGKCPLELDAAALSLVEPAVSDDDTEKIEVVKVAPATAFTLSAAQQALLDRIALGPANRFSTGYREVSARVLVKLGLAQPTGFAGYVYSGIEITAKGIQYLKDQVQS